LADKSQNSRYWLWSTSHLNHLQWCSTIWTT